MNDFLLRLAIQFAITSVENSFPKIKGKDKYIKALALLGILGVDIPDNIESMIRKAVDAMNATGFFTK